VKALAESPWGIFTVGATIPIALFMGVYLRFWRVGRVLEASVIGALALLLAVWGGKLVYQNPQWSQWLGLRDLTLAWAIILYGLSASVLPVWLLLAPRDYLSTFMKLGTIFALAAGIFCVLPDLRMPALSRFVDGSGLVVAGKLFPFCFITIACGAISGFHALISSGTTPKLVTRESSARTIGYGAMCLESLVAIMALIAACTLEPGVYLSMNVKGDPAATVSQVTALGFPVTTGQMSALAQEVGEKTLFGRTGGAATLAVGMAQIFTRTVQGRWLDLWYHFAIMFEALFILTTIDAGTRVARYILQDLLGSVWKPLADTRSLGANLLASGLMVSAWGYFLVQGVRDPLGGINSLWPLFGIANQMLAAIALCLATTVILKMQLAGGGATVNSGKQSGRPWLALVTLVPLVWLVAVTFTAGVEKIGSSDPRIGFVAAAKVYAAKTAAAYPATGLATDDNALRAAQAALPSNQRLFFNNLLDAVVTGAFLLLAGVILLLSVREWILLLARKKLAQLRETPPVWLPDYALRAGQPLKIVGLLALGFALVKELSGEAEMDRARETPAVCAADHTAGSGAIPAAQAPDRKTGGQRYVAMTERRFHGVRRCC
jgi:carbon starvation protein